MIVKLDHDYYGKNRRLHIHLPEEYDRSDARYPVMYFFDGHNLFEDSEATYGKCWGLETFLNSWDLPMILVGMECGHEGDERLSEYLPYPAMRGMFSRFEPRGEMTMDWLLHDVKPMVDSTWRTIPFREQTGVGGSSMGGLMALYAVVHHNRWFSKAACVSTASGFCQPRIMLDMRASTIDPDTRVFLSWGTREAKGAPQDTIDTVSYTYRRNKAVANKLLERGAQPYLWCQVGGGHCEADWEELVPHFMRLLWK